MNKQKLRSLCMKISEETNLSYNSVQTHYFLESILEKIANSKEKENFIFKGGFLLSNIIGIGSRSTIDIDFSVQGFNLTETNIREKLENILLPNNNDNIKYEIAKIKDIRKEDIYGGYKVAIKCMLENIRETISLDIATGDIITPTKIKYEYTSIFENKKISISAYNTETILAEKIQTVYKRDLFNSRCKDFYDIFILYKLKQNSIHFGNLKQALVNTFSHRNTEFDLDKLLELLNEIQSNKDFQHQWNIYQRKFSYAKDLSLEEVITNIRALLNRITEY